MKFSVLIAHYNNANYLPQALDSVLNQSYTSWEIILVDDGSTDNFKNVITKYQHDDRIKIFINQSNRGCGYTKAFCASKATGEIAGFLDPDDALHKEALRSMTQAHIYKPAASIIYSTHYVCDENLIVKRTADNTKELPRHTPYLMLSDGTIHHFATFKMSAYMNTEGISYHYLKAVDQDLYYKLEEAGETFFVNIPLYYYRVHQNGISNGGKEAQALLNHYRIIEQACDRRINKLNRKKPEDLKWINAFENRKRKIKLMRHLLDKKWLNAACSLGGYTLNGGTSDVLAYLKKVQQNGLGVFKKTLKQNNEIKL